MCVCLFVASVPSPASPVNMGHVANAVGKRLARLGGKPDSGEGTRMESEAPESRRILAIDVGSSSVRAGLYDGRGEELDGTEVKREYDFEYTPDGGASKDGDELLDLVASAVDGALSRAEET